MWKRHNWSAFYIAGGLYALPQSGVLIENNLSPFFGKSNHVNILVNHMRKLNSRS
jgi:hypothetical protein